RKGDLKCQLQPPHLLLQKLLRHQRRQRAPNRENHCPRPTATSTISTKRCRRKNSQSLNACANSWKPKSPLLSPTIGLRINSRSTCCRKSRSSASAASP